MKNATLQKMYKTLLINLLCLIASSIMAQVNYTANTRVIPYDSSFRYGVNMGYYPNWTSEQLGHLSAGKASLGLKGVGINTARPALYEEILETFGYNALVPTFESFYQSGIRDMTVIVGGPSGPHRDYTQYCPGKFSDVFANLYEPIWDNGANGTPVNENNYYALYLWKMANSYKKYVKIWEIVNEPDYDEANQQWQSDLNLNYGWWNTNPDPCTYQLHAPIQSYVRMLRISWEVLKSVNPDAQVSIGALGYASFLDVVLRNTDNPNNGQVSNNFPLKGGAYFDVMGYHIYPHIDGSLWTYNLQTDRILGYHRHSDGAIDSGLVKKQAFFQSVLTKHGYDGSRFPQKPWVVTEFNLPRKAFEARYVGSNELQVNSVIKASVECYQRNILQLHVFQLGDQSTPQEANFEFQEMGLYNKLSAAQPYNVRVNPIGIAYKTVSDFLAGSKFDAARTAAMNIASNMDGGAFKQANGTYTYVLWAKTKTDMSEVASATYSFPTSLNLTGLKKYAWDFSETNNKVDIGSQNIALTGSPIFITTSNIVTALPDLTLANLNVNTPSVSAGQTVTFNVDIKNIGAASATGSFVVKSYLSTDNVLSADDIQSGSIPTANFTVGLSVPQVAGALIVPTTLASGQYFVILKVDADNQVSESDENNNVLVSAKQIIVTGTQTGSYCTSKSAAPWELWITNTRFNTINNTSDKFKDFATLGYSDFTNVSTTVNKGQNYPLSISAGLSWAGHLPNAFCRVWIDFNKNNVFEDNEKVLEQNNQNPMTANVLIPTTAVTGAVRMRVAMKWGGYPTACEMFDKGEVEDYIINIQGGGNDPCSPDVTPPLFQNCPSNIVLNTTGTTAVSTWTAPTATDNCSTAPSVSSTHNSGFAFPVGTTNVSYTATDGSNNKSTCSFTVTVTTLTSGSADIAVSIAATPSVFRNYTPLSFHIGAKCNGNQDFTNVKIEFKFPAGTVNGGDVVPSVGTWQQWCVGGIECFTWTIPTLVGNATATLSVPVYVLNPPSPMVATAKLLSSTPTDNFLANNSASITLNQAPPPVASVKKKATQETPVIVQKVSPNPSDADMIVELESFNAREVTFEFSDAFGKMVKIENRQLTQGVNQVLFDISALPQGVYFVSPSANGGKKVPTKFVKM